MKHPSPWLLAAMTLALLSLSCDEGRLVTGIEGEPFQASLQDVSGDADLLVGQEAFYSTEVRLGEDLVTVPVLAWTANPGGILNFDTSHAGTTLEVIPRAPGAVDLKATIDHPNIESSANQKAITVRLDRFEVLAPSSGDTVLTSIGDEILVRVRGIGFEDAVADSAGVEWTHAGSALTLVPAGAPAARDTLRLRAVGPGTDTVSFRQNQSLCSGSPCEDTIYIHVNQVAASVTIDTLRLATLGREGALSATVRDARGNPIPSAEVTWSLADPADTVVIALDASGGVTALGNGTAPVTATAGTAQGSGAVVVRQAIHGVEVPDVVDLDGPGATESVVAVVTDSSGAGVSRPFEVEWTSRAAGVATVTPADAGSASATITATGAGVTRVVASVEGVQDSVTVTVTQELTAVVIEPASLTLNYLGATTALTATARDAQGNVMDGFEATWASLAPGIATVDAAGEVTAVAVGTAGIVAEMEGVADTVDVEVRQVPHTLMILPNPVEDTLFHGETVQLSLAALDSGDVAIQSPEADWSAAPAGIATVSAEGLVTALDVAQLDSVWIRAVAGDGVDSVLIHVDVAILTSVTVEPPLDTIRALTATRQLTATALNQRGNPIPGEAFGWASRDEDVATVDALTGLVTAARDGSTYIVATSSTNTAMLDSALVVVEQTAATVTVHPASHTFDALGDTLEFVARAVDSEGAPVLTAVFDWALAPSGPVTLTVTSDSTVTATAAANGSTTLTATATSNAVEGTASITVQQEPASVEITPTAATVSITDTVHLSAVVRDANANAIGTVGVDWTSLEPAVATVSAAGVVSTLTAGDARIVATPSGTSEPADTVTVTARSYSLQFDGVDDYAVVAHDASLTLGTSWTIEMWVKPATLDGNQYLLLKGSQDILPTGNQSASYLVYLKSGVPALVTRTTGGAAAATTAASFGDPLALDTWSHIAFVFTGQTATVYVNGAEVGSQGGMHNPKAITSPLYIGSLTGTSTFMSGQIDEIRFWSTARTEQEIQDNRSRILFGTPFGLLQYWAIEEGTGNPVSVPGGLVANLGGGTEANKPAWSTESPFNP